MGRDARIVRHMPTISSTAVHQWTRYELEVALASLVGAQHKLAAEFKKLTEAKGLLEAELATRPEPTNA